MRPLHPDTLAAQALGWIDEPSRALIPPIHTATTYERAPDLSYPSGRNYSRDDNPTYDQPEALLAALEGGQEALLFASGMAAATALFLALRPGDHVLAPRVMYWSLRRWLKETLPAWGVAVDLVDMADSDAVAATIRPGLTRLIWVETPANPLLDIVDIATLADIAHAHDAMLAVDSTVATPMLTQPLTHGADLVMHSCTKALNGHSDVIAGALVTARHDALWERIAGNRRSLGAVLGPFEAWLLLRGMRTLHLRVARACANAMAVAEYLAAHPRIATVFYPGLLKHPGHAIAVRQMQGGFGGLLSFRVNGGKEAALALAGRLRVIKRATSLGGTESLIEHRASVEGADSPAPPDLLRLALGIEAAADLIADLEQALG